MITVATKNEIQQLIEGEDPEQHVLDRPLYRVRGELLLVTGIGSVNAAATISAVLQRTTVERVISCGFGGALPGSDLNVGDVLVGTEAVYADLGILYPEGFQGIDEVGYETAPGRHNRHPLMDLPIDGERGVIAEVCTVSATDERASDVRDRTGAMVETMETAATAHTAYLHGIESGAIVGVSNHTGNQRDFDKERAKTALQNALEELLE